MRRCLTRRSCLVVSRLLWEWLAVLCRSGPSVVIVFGGAVRRVSVRLCVVMLGLMEMCRINFYVATLLMSI